MTWTEEIHGFRPGPVYMNVPLLEFVAGFACGSAFA
jgi:hypothetical protein